jgi:hypothetical protein
VAGPPAEEIMPKGLRYSAAGIKLREGWSLE